MSEQVTEDATSTDEETQEVEETEETETEGSEALGDAGKKALDAMKSQRNAERLKARETQKELDRLKSELANKDKPAEEQALEAARAEARAEARATSDKRILKSELRAVAAGKLADPSDAHLYINLDDFSVDDEGETDTDALADAIADLLKRKPHLAAGKQNPFGGSGDGGAKAEPKPDQSIDEAIAEAKKARNFPLVATLRHQKYAAEQAKKG